ncbi:hypothetical protein [Herbaspirillum aquaticum]|nr:hypothetical protein [Herbaspirillum aquaticum]
MKLICCAVLVIFSAVPCFAGQNTNVYLLENCLNMNLPNSVVMLRDQKTGCKVVVEAHSEDRQAVLNAVKEVCPDGVARPVKGRTVLPYGSRGVIEDGADVPMTISY